MTQISQITLGIDCDPIHGEQRGQSPEAKAWLIMHLAKSGYAASDSCLKIGDLTGCLGGVLETIARLAEDLAVDLADQNVRKAK